MNRTGIEWVKNPDGSQGYTWNPITGCLNGCSYCYARRLANGRLKPLYLANDNISKVRLVKNGELDKAELDRALQDPFYPRFWEDRLNEDLGICRGIFPCDMSDLFGIGIPEEWTRQVLDAIKTNAIDRFYLLTKQPQNLVKFSPFSENCWVGVTATNNEMYKLAKWHLDRIEAKVKYISFEPLLEEISMAPPIGIDWVIIGAQTKPYKPPEIEWVEGLVYLFDRYQISIFEKNNLKPLLGNTLRQEMPSKE